MISATNAAIAGMQAFSTKIQSNGENIANANSANYKKSRVTLSTDQAQGVIARVERVEEPGAELLQEATDGQETDLPSNVALEEEIPDMNVNSTLYKANLKTLQVADEMAGTLLNIKG